MRLLVDFHHADLFESHQLVFGDRFGWEVYAPYGIEWFDEWIWSFEREHHGDAVARQYLIGIFAGAEPDANGIVSLADTRHPGRIIKGITLAAARAQGWDFVMSTVPANAPGFAKFARDAGAKWLIHVGNQWGDEAWGREPDAAILTTTSAVPGGVPHVIVHQEFSLTDFRYEPPVGFGPVRSFVNCFPEMTSEYQGNFLPLARAYPEFRWEVYGAYGTALADEFEAGNLHGTSQVAEKMRGSGAIWHAKHWSDGFGHVIHNAFAVGRPVFGYARYYADKLAGPLWVDGVTSWDVEAHSQDETIAQLRMLHDSPFLYAEMCEAATARFHQIVDFEADAASILTLLGSL